MQINVLEYFERAVAAYPNRLAITDRLRGFTFLEIKTGALTIAKKIIQINDVICQPIAVFLPKSIEAVTSFAGILYSANIYVPLDTKLPGERIRTILDNLKPAIVITNSMLLPPLLDAGCMKDQIILLDDAFGIVSDKLDEIIDLRYRHLIDADPAYIIYTSGSTGVPKGVTISHRGIIDYIDWATSVYPVTEKDIIGSQAPFYFDNSTLDIYLCFSCGARLHLIPEEIFAFPVKLIQHVRDFSISTIFWVPSLMTAIANYDILANIPLPALDKVLFAGEVMPARTLNYWRRHLSRAMFSNLYGPTEITVDCTYYLVERTIEDNEPVPIGFPCRNSDVLILNEHNQQAAPGTIGELCVRGSSLSLGYWNAPEKTDAAFVQNPLRPNYPERIYRTGDLVQRNERGEILFIGRKDSQIKHQGYRIELGEIETVANALDGIRLACVLYNQPKQEITMFYEAGAELSARELREKLSRKLPRYMLPLVFKWYKSLPMNANGKIDRNLLGQEL